MQVRKRFAYTLYRKLSFLVLAFAFLPLLQAQKVAFENHTLKTGLPQNTVSDIVQDHQGYLWFATHVGVARYDGYTFEHFNLSDGLPDEVIAYEETDDLGMFAFENVTDGDFCFKWRFRDWICWRMKH
jgi:ligand-binding sensor domain-containing protein